MIFSEVMTPIEWIWRTKDPTNIYIYITVKYMSRVLWADRLALSRLYFIFIYLIILSWFYNEDLSKRTCTPNSFLSTWCNRCMCWWGCSLCRKGDTLVRAQNLGKRLSNLRVGFEDGNMMFHLRVSYIAKNWGRSKRG